MEHHAFDRWLAAYGAAWEARDADAFAALFTDEVRYFWTPFGEPNQGRDGVTAAFSAAVANQRDIDFRYEILAVDTAQCLARWWCALARPATGQMVRLDGILMVNPAADGRCEEFREWWHLEES